jgi:hypothetical protein
MKALEYKWSPHGDLLRRGRMSESALALAFWRVPGKKKQHQAEPGHEAGQCATRFHVVWAVCVYGFEPPGQ